MRQAAITQKYAVLLLLVMTAFDSFAANVAGNATIRALKSMMDKCLIPIAIPCREIKT